MRLYLVQHGEAQSEAVSPERELSAQGRLDVERLATVLVGGREDPPMAAFQPGSIACLESDPAGGWQIVWMLRPELLVEPPPEAGGGEWA